LGCFVTVPSSARLLPRRSNVTVDHKTWNYRSLGHSRTRTDGHGGERSSYAAPSDDPRLD
ncbi:hypothetical protein LINGRAHAP2_LOCUS30151, partial [Linum grandiflorum]